MPFRRLRRDINEDARDVGRALVDTAEFEKSRDERKKVEMCFAHLRPITASSACDSGACRARDKFHLAAIARNLKTLASRIWRQRGSSVRCVDVSCVEVALVVSICVKRSLVVVAAACCRVQRSAAEAEVPPKNNGLSARVKLIPYFFNGTGQSSVADNLFIGLSSSFI